MNNEVDDILYFGDRDVFSLNAVLNHAFSCIIYSCSQIRFMLCIFHLILVQNSCFRRFVTRL